jgi:hypothetical protein
LALMGYFAVRSGNKSLLRNGLPAEAEILSCRNHKESRNVITEVTFSFIQKGHTTPVKVTKMLSGHVDIEVGTKIPVKYLQGHPYICLLVPYEKLHSAT